MGRPDGTMKAKQRKALGREDAQRIARLLDDPKSWREHISPDLGWSIIKAVYDLNFERWDSGRFGPRMALAACLDVLLSEGEPSGEQVVLAGQALLDFQGQTE